MGVHLLQFPVLIEGYKPKHYCLIDKLSGQPIVDLYNVVELFLQDRLVLCHMQMKLVGMNCMYCLVCPLHEYETLQLPQILP